MAEAIRYVIEDADRTKAEVVEGVARAKVAPRRFDSRIDPRLTAIGFITCSQI